MTIKVEKNHFYEGGLRYIESTEPSSCKDHFDCNCTKTVAEKPTTKLKSTQVSVTAFLNRGEYEIEINLMADHFSYVFRWDDKHAYFDMTRANCGMDAPPGIKMEISNSGWNCVDYFMTGMLFGQRVNTSTMMNGHAPSRIIDLNKIDREDVWLHDCEGGVEAMRLFANSVERSDWKRLRGTTENIEYWTAMFKPEAEYNIHEIKEMVENQKFLPEAIDWCVDFLCWVIDNLENTELFKLGSKIRDEIKN